ncbi:MAG: hypothetical protein GX595_20345, partial [Lentisphaerae bacterium]|nr:hypothetical protein [Lentisphaerota bacterium]
LVLAAEQATATQEAAAIATLAARLANTPPSEADRRQSPVCDHCGSDNVSVDGACRWDGDAFAWSLQSIFDDDGHCDDCCGECRIKWVPVSGVAAVPQVQEHDVSHLGPHDILEGFFALSAEQGWDTHTDLLILSNFIKQSGLANALQAFAGAVAKIENGES